MKEISKKNWSLIWILGLTGQICWNVENSWFNTFVYAKVAKDPAIISWMVGVSAIVTTMATFLVGTWSDRVARRKPFIAVGYIFWGIFTICFGAAEFLPKSPFIAIVFFLVAADSVMSFFGSVGYDAGFSAWTTDISSEHNRGRLGGVFAALPVLATIFGAVVSGMLIDTLDFFPFFILMGGLVSLMGVLTLFALKDDPDLKARKDVKGYLHQVASVFNLKTVLANKELFWVFMIMMVYFFGFNIYFPYITIYLNNYLGMSYSLAGALQGGGLVAAVLMTIPAAKYIDRGKPIPVMTWAIGANFAGLVLVSLKPPVPLLLLGIFGAGLGFVLALQTLTAWVKNLYPEEQRGQFEGIKQLFFVCLPMVIGPSIAGVIINATGVPMVIDGVSGLVPTEMLFRISAFFTLLTFLPLIPAAHLHQVRYRQREMREIFDKPGR